MVFQGYCFEQQTNVRPRYPSPSPTPCARHASAHRSRWTNRQRRFFLNDRLDHRMHVVSHHDPSQAATPRADCTLLCGSIGTIFTTRNTLSKPPSKRDSMATITTAPVTSTDRWLYQIKSKDIREIMLSSTWSLFPTRHGFFHGHDRQVMKHE